MLKRALWVVLALLGVAGCKTTPDSNRIAISSSAVFSLSGESGLPNLPVAISNNAVAAVVLSDEHFRLYSFSGLLAGRSWRDVSNRAFEYDSVTDDWRELSAAPGPGRLASTAQVVAGQIFLFGGYTVAEDGAEVSTPQVHQFDPQSRNYRVATTMPVPVDDAVSGVYRDRYIYLISGWHDTDNVANVQVLDTQTGAWLQATPFPGPPVFGHAGGLVNDRLLICGGVKVVPGSMPGDQRRFEMSDQCWVGLVDPIDPALIAWRRVASHSGPALYRAASGPVGSQIVIAGGTDNPFNYNGIGYNGVPSVPRAGCHRFDPSTTSWSFDETCPAMMDQRGVVAMGGQAWVLGGMVPGR